MKYLVRTDAENFRVDAEEFVEEGLLIIFFNIEKQQVAAVPLAGLISISAEHDSAEEKRQ